MQRFDFLPSTGKLQRTLRLVITRFSFPRGSACMAPFHTYFRPNGVPFSIAADSRSEYCSRDPSPDDYYKEGRQAGRQACTACISGDFSNCRRCTAKRGTITQHPPTDPRIEGDEHRADSAFRNRPPSCLPSPPRLARQTCVVVSL